MQRTPIRFRSSVIFALCLVACLIGLLWLPPTSPTHGQTPPAIFHPIGPVFQGTFTDSLVRRQVPVEVDISQLETGNVVEFNLFPNLSIDAHVKEMGMSTDGKTGTCIGDVSGFNNLRFSKGDFSMAINGQVVSANIITEDGALYEIRSDPYGRIGTNGMVHWIREMNYNKFPEGDNPTIIPASTIQQAAEANEQSTPKAVNADNGSRIDVLVLYTPAALQLAGSQAAMDAEIQLAITETNQGYANSGVIQRLRLVHKAQIASTNDENAVDYSVLTDRLTNPSDGIYDNAHTLRNQFGADQVSLWVVNYSNCGRANLGGPGATAVSGFSVVQYDCATGYFSFGHEMGHNYGALHDAAGSGGSSGVFPYGFGFLQLTASPPYRTIMAYNCPGGCVRVNYWSNPNVLYKSVPTGTATANNARVLNDGRVTVANWRQTVVP